MAILTFMVFTFVGILVSAWYRYIKAGPVYKKKISLKGKTVLITGGSSGVGKEAAIGLAKCHARVIIASRDIVKGKNAAAEIREQSGNDNVTFMKLDLGDLEDVKDFADNFVKNVKRLDLLVNCAGVISSARTEDHEHGLMFACNVLGPFLLTNELLPLLEATSIKSPTRIVNIASDAYLIADINLMELDPYFDEKTSTLTVLGHYAATKLMVIYMNAELGKILSFNGNGVTTYALHPGTAQSNLGADFTAKRWLFNILRWFVMKVLARSPHYCAQGILFCCMEPDIEKHSGGYFSEFRRSTLHPHATKTDVGRKLWAGLQKLSGLTK